MRKGRHRRHQSARDLKRGVGLSADAGLSISAVLEHHADVNDTGLDVLPAEMAKNTHAVDAAQECDECQRWPHAEWCMADEDEEY